MSSPDSTCWTVIEAAAAGSAADRESFAREYGPVVRAYLAARWAASPHLSDLDDAIQEVFIACFKENGVLDRAQRGRGFRPFFYGVIRNVARQIEQIRARRREMPTGDTALEAIPDDEASLTHVFDRAWARALVREAGRLMAKKAEPNGAALRRVELLRLRFQESLTIRAIAELWQEKAANLHHEYAKARQEFHTALREVVRFHLPSQSEDVEQECLNLLLLLG